MRALLDSRIGRASRFDCRDHGRAQQRGDVAVIELTKQHARRMAVRVARLDADRPQDVADLVRGVADLVRGVAMLRVEPTNTVAPAADHACWSRLGSSYRPLDAERALCEGLLFERGRMLRPMSDLGLSLAGMRT